MWAVDIHINNHIQISSNKLLFKNQSIIQITGKQKKETKILEKSRVRWRVLTNDLRIDFLPVKIPVTTTSGAPQSFNGSFISGGHKFTATVDGVTSNVSSVILLTLHVTDVTDRRWRRWSSSPRRRRVGVSWSLLYDHLSLLHHDLWNPSFLDLLSLKLKMALWSYERLYENQVKRLEKVYL